jgi:hypothetical protein
MSEKCHERTLSVRTTLCAEPATRAWSIRQSAWPTGTRQVDLPVRLLFDGPDARWAARDLDLAGHLQRLAVEAQHIERFVEHGLRQQRLAILAPDHLCVPKIRFGVDAASGRRKLAS